MVALVVVLILDQILSNLVVIVHMVLAEPVILSEPVLAHTWLLPTRSLSLTRLSFPT